MRHDVKPPRWSAARYASSIIELLDGVASYSMTKPSMPLSAARATARATVAGSLVFAGPIGWSPKLRDNAASSNHG
jgi:hypothetical protein